MSYKRKTTDEYVLLADYGYGWDEVLAEDSAKEIRRRLTEYRQNTSAALKITKRRVSLSEKGVYPNGK